MVPQIAPAHSRIRMSSDAAWPLRCSDGRTFAERKADAERERKRQQ